MKPKKVVYVSCNPSTLARDLKILSGNGFKVMEVQPVDMFPHTPHVESIILMTYCGSGGKKQGLTTTYSGLRTVLEQKQSEKTSFFDPCFWGDLQMTQGKKSDDIIKVEKLMAQKEGEIILWDDKNFI